MTRIFALSLALLLATRWGEAARGASSPACHEESRVAMGCTGTVRACGPDAKALPAIVGEALDEIDRIDRLMSHYIRDSPLSRLNREAANGPVAVEPELFDFLAECLRWSGESHGAFDVTVGPLMKAWGFFRDEGRVPAPDELARVIDGVGYRHVVLDAERGTVRFDRPGVELDLGGIGKGYAVDRAVTLLRRRGVGSALVNLGGSSVYGLGAPPGLDAWKIRIQDPTNRARTALTVRLRDRALSVAGGYERFFEEKGVTYAHIMDPRTGRPVQGVLSVAVLTDAATDGDALDDALFVLGVEGAGTFRERLRSTTAFFFLPTTRGRWKLVRLGREGPAQRKSEPETAGRRGVSQQIQVDALRFGIGIAQTAGHEGILNEGARSGRQADTMRRGQPEPRLCGRREHPCDPQAPRPRSRSRSPSPPERTPSPPRPPPSRAAPCGRARATPAPPRRRSSPSSSSWRRRTSTPS